MNYEALTVESINIRRKGYSSDGPFIATVNIHGEYQKLELLLPDDLSNKIVGVIAEQIVAGSRQVADRLSQSALNFNALEHKP